MMPPLTRLQHLPKRLLIGQAVIFTDFKQLLGRQATADHKFSVSPRGTPESRVLPIQYLQQAEFT